MNPAYRSQGPESLMGRIDPDILDRGTVMNPVYRSQGPESLMGRDVQVSDVFMDAVESAPLLGNNPPPSLTQGLPERPMIRSQGPESLRGGVESNLMFGERGSSRNADGSLRVSQPIMARPGDYLPPNPEERDQSPRYQALRGRTGLGSPPVVTARRQVDLMPALAPPSSPITPDVRQQIEREIQMERAGVRPNVRPTPAPVVAPAPVIVPKPAPVVAAPTSPSDVQQQIMRQIQMEQAGVRPNVRPTMNVGKATGGPVGIHSGIASLVGRR